MHQPPDLAIVTRVLERARILHGDEAADVLAGGLARDWQAAAGEGEAQALYTAGQQLRRAARYRELGQPLIANMCARLAEACVSGWVDELTVVTTSVENSPPAE